MAVIKTAINQGDIYWVELEVDFSSPYIYNLIKPDKNEKNIETNSFSGPGSDL